MRHFTVASVISSESAISVYESPTTSRSRSAILRSTLRASTARQTASIASSRSIGASTTSSGGTSSSATTARGGGPSRGADDAPGAAPRRPQLVEHAVLRHLEEPGRELRAGREAREPLEDAEEDLLGQILGQGAVADEAQDVVVDRNLIGADDERKRPLIAFLGLPQDAKIRLLK